MEMFPVNRSATWTMAWSSARYAVCTFPGSGWAWLCTLFCLSKLQRQLFAWVGPWGRPLSHPCTQSLPCAGAPWVLL
eukprot:3339787-Heterocapsa_arctica.AAC.1